MLVRLKIALLKSGRTQIWLAEHTGISPTRLSRLIRGRTRLRGSERENIATALDLPPTSLFPSFRPVFKRGVERPIASRLTGRGRTTGRK
jgi:transcriptional regulator with XRE-family HTH domain